MNSNLKYILTLVLLKIKKVEAGNDWRQGITGGRV